MRENIYSKICGLPDNTSIFCGHEYSVPNLAFALWVEPDNEAAREKVGRECAAWRGGWRDVMCRVVGGTCRGVQV